MDQNEKKQIEHHKQLEFCKTRPAYRQGKKLTAVKVILQQIQLNITIIVFFRCIRLIRNRNICSFMESPK